MLLLIPDDRKDQQEGELSALVAKLYGLGSTLGCTSESERHHQRSCLTTVCCIQ